MVGAPERELTDQKWPYETRALDRPGRLEADIREAVLPAAFESAPLHPAHADRFGAYVARYMARNVVAAGLARRCEVQLSYGVGEERPLAVAVETFGTGAVPDERIEKALADEMDLRPSHVVDTFALRLLPEKHGGEFFRRLAAYGHFGRTDLDAPWEREDLAEALGRVAGRAS